MYTRIDKDVFQTRLQNGSAHVNELYTNYVILYLMEF